MRGRDAYVGPGDGGGAGPGPRLRRPDGPARSFVALPCPPRLRSRIAEARRTWREISASVRWSDPERIHLTLRFLGTASPAALEALHARLVETARDVAPVTFAPGAAGAFPGWERARVLWIGLEDADGAIERLAAAVEADARAAGFEPEERSFVPHLTLGRVKGRRGVRAAIDALREWRPDSKAEEVEEMILYESQLGRGGATHTPLARYPLGGGDG